MSWSSSAQNHAVHLCQGFKCKRPDEHPVRGHNGRFAAELHLAQRRTAIENHQHLHHEFSGRLDPAKR